MLLACFLELLREVDDKCAADWIFSTRLRVLIGIFS